VIFPYKLSISHFPLTQISYPALKQLCGIYAGTLGRSIELSGYAAGILQGRGQFGAATDRERVAPTAPYRSRLRKSIADTR